MDKLMGVLMGGPPVKLMGGTEGRSCLNWLKVEGMQYVRQGTGCWLGGDSWCLMPASCSGMYQPYQAGWLTDGWADGYLSASYPLSHRTPGLAAG